MIPPHLVAGCVKRLDIVREKSVPREIPENHILTKRTLRQDVAQGVEEVRIAELKA